MSRSLASKFLALLLLFPLNAAFADWELDSTRSTINFVSIKNNSVGEMSSFTSLLGFISAQGKVQITVNLDSVATLIDIRDERMREMLFETATFPAATISAQVDPVVLAAVGDGGVATLEVPVTVSLHGQEKQLNMPLVATGEAQGQVRVLSARPVLLNAADFGLEPGVAALQKVAGLSAISRVVPVTLQLVFTAAE